MLEVARVWLVRRRGNEWIAPGGKPAYELPLADLIFPLDLAPHRQLTDERPVPAPELPPAEPAALVRVMIETTPEDLTEQEFCGFSVGVYDSPYSPQMTVRRLALLTSRS